MIIYEKENTLNVSFENSVNETPDIQIGKDGDKTQILVDGQPGGGSGNGVLICTDTNGTLDKTMGEIQTAYHSGKTIIIDFTDYTVCVIGLKDVFYDGRMAQGFLRIAELTADGDIWSFVTYWVSEETEEAALSAYPITNDYS